MGKVIHRDLWIVFHGMFHAIGVLDIEIVKAGKPEQALDRPYQMLYRIITPTQKTRRAVKPIGFGKNFKLSTQVF